MLWYFILPTTYCCIYRYIYSPAQQKWNIKHLPWFILFLFFLQFFFSTRIAEYRVVHSLNWWYTVQLKLSMCYASCGYSWTGEPFECLFQCTLLGWLCGPPAPSYPARLIAAVVVTTTEWSLSSRQIDRDSHDDSHQTSIVCSLYACTTASICAMSKYI